MDNSKRGSRAERPLSLTAYRSPLFSVLSAVSVLSVS
jgi:hypothetical protein